MSDEDESFQKTRSRFDELSRGLNLDEDSSREAWSRYEDIRRTFTLEVHTHARFNGRPGDG